MTEETVFVGIDDVSQPSDKFRVAKDLAAGTFSGFVQVLVGQPFDTTKVRLASDTIGRYKGAGDVVKTLIAEDGLKAFYKGTLTPLIGVGACVSIQFGVNEYMKRVVFKNEKHLSSWEYYTSGSVSGLANSFLASPIELIRSRLQAQTTTDPSKKKGPLDVIKEVKAKRGASGLFRGLLPTALREAHGMGIYFLTYEYLVKTDTINNKIERYQIPGHRLCLYGATSGIFLWLSVYPVDFIKSRLQTDSLDRPKYKGFSDVARQVWKAEGAKGFFRGFTPTILRAAPANAATFYAFEIAMRFLG